MSARGLLPFPPLPAVFLLPFVAVWGLATDDQRLFTLLAAIDVAICWWMLGRLDIRLAIRAATTAFFAFGTVFWYSAQLATTWYQAHIVAVGLTMLACGLAHRGGPGRPTRSMRTMPAAEATGPRLAGPVPVRASIDASCWPGSCSASPRRPGSRSSSRPRSCCSSGPAGSAWRRGWSAAIGAADPGRPAARLQPRLVRPAHPAGVRLPVPSGDRRLSDPGLSRRLGHRGSTLPAPEPRDHAARARPTSCRIGCRTPSATTTRPSARSPAPPAACSTWPVRWPCPRMSA